jgi:hypothetical protein
MSGSARFMSTPALLAEQDGHVLTVTINRPRARFSRSAAPCSRAGETPERTPPPGGMKEVT